MNKQEAFNKIVQHLLTQNKASLSKKANGYKDLCMYRSEDGLKCAIGCLISAEEYDLNMEGRSVAQLRQEYSKLSLFELDDTFLNAMQNIHDEFPPSMWKEKFIDYALRNDLIYPIT